MQRARRYVLACLALLCTGALAQSAPIALIGTLLTPQEIVENGTLLIADGRIVASGADIKVLPGTKVIHTHGILAPGLIDLHNHLTWNVSPRWQPGNKFGNRYDWQQTAVYKSVLVDPHSAIQHEHLECEAERYAEVKAITEGETSVVGSMHSDCDPRVTRDLDFDPRLGPGLGKVIYNVFPLEMNAAALDEANAVLAGSPRGALLIHVSEGGPHDAAAAREFAMLKARCQVGGPSPKEATTPADFEPLHGLCLLRPGVSLIHAVAVRPEGFEYMAAHAVGFIWSPRSNFELYGDTADVPAAKAAGVRMAIAPDWSPTGSAGMLSELDYAAQWNEKQTPPLFTDRDLFLMATANAAELVNLSAQLGSLAAGHAADVIVLKPSTLGRDAYYTLTHATPDDIQLLMIGGVALYGEPSMLQRFGVAAAEPIKVCGAPKALATAAKSFAATERLLDAALHTQGQSLAPLAECSH